MQVTITLGREWRLSSVGEEARGWRQSSFGWRLVPIIPLRGWAAAKHSFGGDAGAYHPFGGKAAANPPLGGRLAPITAWGNA